jgi:hypothetical protein
MKRPVGKCDKCNSTIVREDQTGTRCWRDERCVDGTYAATDPDSWVTCYRCQGWPRSNSSRGRRRKQGPSGEDLLQNATHPTMQTKLERLTEPGLSKEHVNATLKQLVCMMRGQEKAVLKAIAALPQNTNNLDPVLKAIGKLSPNVNALVQAVGKQGGNSVPTEWVFDVKRNRSGIIREVEVHGNGSPSLSMVT